jgi:hypothetical protein
MLVGFSVTASAVSIVPAQPWRLLSIPGPREGHSLVFDERRGRLVTFGGEAGQWGTPRGVFEEVAGRWRHVLTPHLPPLRAGQGGAFDATRGRVIMFGGGANGVSFDDTWVYDGIDWIELTTSPRPPARNSGTLVHDPVRGRTVLFGGARPGTGP